MTGADQPLLDLFAKLIELPAEARAGELQALRAVDADLAKELARLLDSHDRCGDFLEDFELEQADRLLRADADLRRPFETQLQVGPYRLGEQLGHGGMGVVHLAERVEGGFEQRVAIKVVRPEVDTDKIHQGFLAERQILARLEHPNIARLLDGGVTDDGRPFFAMEYVEGETITSWCRNQALGLDDRLRLFVRVCNAVQYAHANLIVHRDLKPSNILVDSGEPKLLDFGIAKLLDRGAQAARDHDGVSALTPEYAAPEQRRGGAVTTATDVYSLGVVLYELLTGRRPESTGATSSPNLDRLPRAPSRAMVEAAPADETNATATASWRLARRLAGDLDAVVLRALEPEPERRYRTAEAFAADVTRFLERRPVEARTAPPWDRARLFFRRHRAVVLAALAVAGALTIGTTVASIESLRASREARRAQEALSFLVDMLERADPSQSMGETVTARELLDEGARRLRMDDSLDPLVQAELADVLARTYRGLGRLDEAAEAATQARDLFVLHLGPVSSRTLLAKLTQTEITFDRGKIDDAREQVDVLLPRLLEAHGEGGAVAERGRTLNAAVLAAHGDYEGALTENRAVLQSTLARLGPDHPQVAERLTDVASSLAGLSRYEESERTIRQALDTLERVDGLESPQGARVQRTLANILDQLGRNEESAQLFAAALATAEAALGPEHPDVAQILIQYGFVLIEQRRAPEAEAALLRAIRILEPLKHFDAGAALRYLGFLDLAEERFEDAIERFERAKRILSERVGEEHPLTLSAEVTAAYAAGRNGDIEPSETRLRAAIGAIERIQESEPNAVRMPRKYLGQIVRLAGRPREALTIHRAVLDLERRLFDGDSNLSAAMTKEQIALDLLAAGGQDERLEARQLVTNVLEFLEENEAEPGRIGRLLLASGRISAAEGNVERARGELEKAAELLAQRLSPDVETLREAKRRLDALPD